MHPPARLALVLGAAALLGVVGVLLGLPPYHNRFSCVAQLWLGRATGLWLHHRPEHFSGTYRLWDERGRLRCEYGYLRGQRDGRWVDYDSNGLATGSCVYSNGEPWEGICHFWEGKAWVGEYRAGRPWQGCLPTQTSSGEIEWHSYIDGVEVSADDYKARYKIPASSQVIGLHHTN